MIGEAHLRNAVTNLRQAVNELHAANDEFRRAIDQHRTDTDKHVNQITQQISQADHDASDQQRSDQERMILQQRSHVLRTEIDNIHRQFTQFDSDVRRQISQREGAMNQLENFARIIEQNIAHGIQ